MLGEIVEEAGGGGLNVEPWHGLIHPDLFPEGGLIELLGRDGGGGGAVAAAAAAAAVAAGASGGGWWSGHGCW